LSFTLATYGSKKNKKEEEEEKHRLKRKKEKKKLLILFCPFVGLLFGLLFVFG
jgi:hypothetical protein